MASAADVTAGIRRLGLDGLPVCLHSSMRSFGPLEGGADALIDAFLAEDCTLVVPTFSWQAHAAKPPAEATLPGRNAFDPARASDGNGPPFTTWSTRIDADAMGAIPATVLKRTAHARGNHPLCSFSTIGPLAAPIAARQNGEDVFGPLAELAARDGLVVLAGVGLTRMTLVHLAEQLAGRRMFVRWALTSAGVVPVRSGGCSEGFWKLKPALDPVTRQTTVGFSRWHVFNAGEALDRARRAILEDPEVTRCGDADCTRCRDSIAGGPA